MSRQGALPQKVCTRTDLLRLDKMLKDGEKMALKKERINSKIKKQVRIIKIMLKDRKRLEFPAHVLQ